MIVVSQCPRLYIVDGKGAGVIHQLLRSSRIARTRASRLHVDERERCLGSLDFRGHFVAGLIDGQGQHPLQKRVEFVQLLARGMS